MTPQQARARLAEWAAMPGRKEHERMLVELVGFVDCDYPHRQFTKKGKNCCSCEIVIAAAEALPEEGE